LVEEINIEKMTLGELKEEISKFEKKYGATFEELMRKYEDEEANPEVAIDQMIWETLEETKKERLLSGRIELKNSEPNPTQVFTPKRMELLKVLSEKSPATIKELAEKTRRHLKAVYNDIKLLEKLEFVKIKKKEGNLNVSISIKQVIVKIG